LLAAKIARYQMISDEIGVSIHPRTPFDMVGAFVFSWLFYELLNKVQKNTAITEKSSYKENKNEELNDNSRSNQVRQELKEKTTKEYASNYQPPEDGSASVKAHASKDINSHFYATAFEDFMKAKQNKDMKVELKEKISNGHASEYQPPEDIDYHFYATAFDEIEKDNYDKGIWAKAFAESNGHEAETKAKYIKARAAQLHAAERLDTKEERILEYNRQLELKKREK